MSKKSHPKNIASTDGDSVNRLASLSGSPEPDPFNAEEFRIHVDFFQSAPVKKLITTIRVKKPNPQDFIRVHPDPAQRSNLVLLELKDDREKYLVIPSLYHHLEEIERTGSYTATVFLCVNRQKNPFLWDIRLPGPDGRVLEWHSSARSAAETAMSHWIRVVPNMNNGSYDVLQAQLPYSEPEWPDLSYCDLLKIAFKDRIIREPDHPVLQRLRGAV